MLKLEIEVVPDARSASVKIATVGGTEEFILTAADLDEVIEALGSARMAVSDEVPLYLDPSVRVRSVGSAVIHVHHISEETSVICIRDPAYGWTASELTRSDRHNLIQALSKKI